MRQGSIIYRPYQCIMITCCRVKKKNLDFVKTVLAFAFSQVTEGSLSIQTFTSSNVHKRLSTYYVQITLRGFSDPPPPFSAIETFLSQFVWQKDTFLKNFLKGWYHPALHCLRRCRCKHFHFHGEPGGRTKVWVLSFR